MHRYPHLMKYGSDASVNIPGRVHDKPAWLNCIQSNIEQKQATKILTKTCNNTEN